jgi:DNA-binding protein H-NS
LWLIAIQEDSMKRTLVQIRKQIESLEKEAKSIHDKEVAGVIARIKEAISFYGLSSKDLFGPDEKKTASIKRGASKLPRKVTARKPAIPKFRDESSGNTWTGHGRRPGWFVEAIASGKPPEELAVKPQQ